MNILKNSFKLSSNTDQINYEWFGFSPFNLILIPLAATSIFILGNIWLFSGAILVISIILFIQIRNAYRKSTNKKVSALLSILIVIAIIFTMFIFFKFSEFIRETGIY